MKAVAKIFGVLVGILVLFTFGYSWRDIQRGSLPSVDTMAALIGRSPSQTRQAPQAVFRSAFVHIERNFYGTVDRERLRSAGFGGMLASLGDPHTVYLDAKATQEFQLETRAVFAGVGARLAPDPLGARVVTVFEGGPAAGAGMKAGDLIVGVDGKSVGGIDLSDIVDQVRGPEGTTVRVTVQREGLTQPLTLTIRRARIVAPTITSKMLPDSKIGLIEISSFSQPTGSQFASALDKLDREGMTGLIVDVRNNPGGLLESAVEILSFFVENKVVVKMRMRNGLEEVARTPPGFRRDVTVPIVVLINEDSASAAEIFAGVLRDYRLATLVGVHTYGKASVQNVFPLIDQASAKVTIARYYLPGGQDISRKVDEDGRYVSGGIDADVKIEAGPDDVPVFGEPERDAQLRKAIEVIQSKRGSANPVRAQVQPDPDPVAKLRSLVAGPPVRSQPLEAA
ncbi:MAG: S41 family peptidase [Fimbriimonadaceae bacterium]